MPESDLIMSEHFYSIQGEGVSAGVPAVFLRLAACNLKCNGFSYRDPTNGEHLGCDSKAVWRQGNRWSNQHLLEHWQKHGWLDAINRGAHLILTGGEPLIQQHKLLSFIAALDKKVTNAYLEIETNATIAIEPALFERLNQINASPKLRHSGEPDNKRYHPDIIQQILTHPLSVFKFVVANETDFEEIITDYQDKLAIPARKILIMAEGGDQKTLRARTQWIVECCKRYGFRYTPRLQVDIWDEVTGV